MATRSVDAWLLSRPVAIGCSNLVEERGRNAKLIEWAIWKSAVTNPKVNVMFRARRDDGLLRWKHTTPQRHRGV